MSNHSAAPLASPPLFTTRVAAGGWNAHVVVFEGGLTIGSRPGRGRLVPWSEILRVAEGPAPDRYGVVVDGRLAIVFDEETEATDRAADQRQLGSDATVIRVPVSITS